MLTGAKLDMTPFGPLLTAVGVVYWLLALGLAAFALWVQGRWWIKVPVALLIVAGFVYPVLTRVKVQEQQIDTVKARLAASQALFEVRCKSAGEKITRTVENVDGVVWMKWRDKGTASDDSDQFKLFDPYGRDCNVESCIEQLLRLETNTGRFKRDVDLRKGRYRFVESTDPADGQRYRYTGTMKVPSSWTPEGIEKYRREKGTDIPDDSYRFALQRSPIGEYTVRYGITWDDISTREDREHWIAGGSLKVIDLQTNEVIADRIGYMMDRGQGSTAGFRSPCLYAERTACSEFARSEAGNPMKYSRSRAFVFNVLKPITEN
jgi:hypothetical protein